MTTTELIKKAYDFASQYMDVRSIEFQNNFNFERKTQSMEINFFYKFFKVEGNSFVTVYSSEKNYGAEALLKEFKKEVKAIHRREFPKPEKPQTTEIEIK